MEQQETENQKIKRKKAFVLDTNVILHGARSYFSFKENDVVISIDVLSELDNFKIGNSEMNYNARKFIHLIDKLPPAELFNGGASLGKGLGKIRVVMGVKYHGDVHKVFPEKKTDHNILNTVY